MACKGKDRSRNECLINLSESMWADLSWWCVMGNVFGS